MTAKPEKVKPDPSWTWQEKWVWSKLLDGEIADFNSDPRFGGPLDPKKDELWTDDNEDAKNRILTPKFLQAILRDKPYMLAIPRLGVLIRGAWFREPIEMENASLERRLGLFGCRIDSAVHFNQLRSKESIALNGSIFRGILNMNGMHIGSGLFMRNGAEFSEVDLTGAKVDGLIYMNESRFNGNLHMSCVHVGGDLFMRNGAEFSEVDLGHAKVNGQVDMNKSRFNGKLYMESLQIGQNLIMAPVAIEKKCSMLFAVIDGSLLVGNRRNKRLPSIDMTGTHVKKDFQLLTGKNSWLDDAKLTLRNTAVGALQDRKDAWTNKLDMDGFTYNRLGGLTVEIQEMDRWEDRGTKWMTEWLAKHEPYSPQPYEQLAKVLRESGHKDSANEILYVRKVREYNEKEKGLGKAWLWLLDKFIGYGYYPKRVLIWIAIFTATGALSLSFSGQGHANNMPYGLSYSFDMLLPIIELNKMHYSEAIKITGWVKYYFYFHKLIGWFLASVLIAGLSGITKK